MNQATLIALSVFLLLTGQDIVQAQRGGGSDFRQRMMERMDRNGDGRLEESEVPEGRGREFVLSMARQAGGNGRFPISISDVSGGGSSRGRGGDRGSDRGGNDRGRSGDRSRGQEEKKEFQYTLVPRFGAPVGGFGLDPRQLDNRIVDVDATYDDGILRQLNQTMERYDKDKDGVLDYEEWEGVPWQTDPRESDLNNDGNLTRAEMAERYRKTNASRSSSSNRDQGSRGDRGGDRGDRGGDRGDRGGDRGDRGGDRGGRGGDRGGSRGGGDQGGGRGGFGGFGGRGGGGDEGGRGGRGGGDQSGGRGGFDPSSLVERLDKDGDGYIDFDKELDERSKFMASRFLPRYGIEPKGRVKLDTILKKMGGGQQASSKDKGKGKGLVNPEMVASKTTTGADTFGQHTYRKGKPEVEDVPDWFGERDKDKDGQVTMGEYLKTPSNDAVKKFNELDYNGDGIIVPSEAQ